MYTKKISICGIQKIFIIFLCTTMMCTHSGGKMEVMPVLKSCDLLNLQNQHLDYSFLKSALQLPYKSVMYFFFSNTNISSMPLNAG